MVFDTQYDMMLNYMTPFINQSLGLDLDITDWDIKFIAEPNGFDYRLQMFTTGLFNNLNIYIFLQLGFILQLSYPQFEDTPGLNNELTTNALVNGQSVELDLNFNDKVSYIVSGTVDAAFYKSPTGDIKPPDYVISNPNAIDNSLQLLIINSSEILTINTSQAILIQPGA